MIYLFFLYFLSNMLLYTSSFTLLFQYSLTPVQYLNLAYDSLLEVYLTLHSWHELIVPIFFTLMLCPFFNLIVDILIKDNYYKTSLVIIIDIILIRLYSVIVYPQYNAYIIETGLLTTSIEIYPLWV